MFFQVLFKKRKSILLPNMWWQCVPEFRAIVIERCLKLRCLGAGQAYKVFVTRIMRMEIFMLSFLIEFKSEFYSCAKTIQTCLIAIIVDSLQAKLLFFF